jgi:hypothetical protein
MAAYVEQKYLLPDKYSSVGFQILVYCYANKLPLSSGEVKALATFYLDGVNEVSESRIIDTGIFTSPQSLKNLKSKLVKLKVLEKTSKGYIINNYMGVAADDKIAISIKAGNL